MTEEGREQSRVDFSSQDILSVFFFAFGPTDCFVRCTTALHCCGVLLFVDFSFLFVGGWYGTPFTVMTKKRNDLLVFEEVEHYYRSVEITVILQLIVESCVHNYVSSSLHATLACIYMCCG